MALLLFVFAAAARPLSAQETTTAPASAPQSWGAAEASGGAFQDMEETAVLVNPCDNVAVETPYYIGNLATAAANCTVECPTSTYQDTNQVCHPCKIVGCATCAGAVGDTCEDCLIFHMAAGGQCVYLFGGVFLATALFAFIFVLGGILRFCICGLCTARNSGVLREALRHRNRSKVHIYELPGNPAPSYDGTNVRKENISGVGPVLYFRFVAFVAMLMFMIVFLEAFFLVLRSFGDSSVSSESSGYNLMADPQFQELCYAILLYAICLFMILRWVQLQSREVARDVREGAHLRNYALVAQGFPKTAQSPLEVKAFFESILSFELEGVSIAYDYTEEVDFVEDRVSQAIEKADTHIGLYPSEYSSVESYGTDSQDSYVVKSLNCSGYAFVVFSTEEDREYCMRRFHDIDKEVQRSRAGEDQDSEDEADESSALLPVDGPRKGRGPRRKGRGGTGPSRAVLYGGKYGIQVGHAPEPCGIQWHNFVVRRGARTVRVVVAFLMALLIVALVSGVIFAPAYLAEMSFLNIVASSSPTQDQTVFAALEQGMVSVSIAVNNRLLIAFLRWAAQMSGFLQKVNEDTIFAVFAFFTVVFGSTVPLIITSIVAATESSTPTGELLVNVLFQVLWMNILVTEVEGLLLPAWSYWTSFFWVRGNKAVAVRDAEPRIQPPEFPFAARYVDVIHVLTLGCTMISISSLSLYTVAGQCLLLLYFTYVYFVDKYKFLRVNRQTHYTSPKLDTAMHYVMVLPLAAVSVYPLRLLNLSELQTTWIKLCIFLSAVFAYMLVARLLQWCNQPEREIGDMPYTEVASQIPYNYFNTNPVHVLRALHFPSIMAPPIFPYRSGKEYLQGGQFSDYNDDVKLRETLLLLAKSPLKSWEGFGNPQDF